jgi:pseudouridine-5'-phosphate glycosidase
LFATVWIGGVHAGYGSYLDVSSDLAALARFPVAVVASGVKSILDVAATREALEALGVPVVGWGTDAFPAFYLRRTEPALGVDGRFDEIGELGAFVRMELARTGRGVLIVNPIAEEHEVPVEKWEMWLREARAAVEAEGVSGRGVTPAVLGKLHEISGGATLRANVELVKGNAAVAGRLARAMDGARI